MRVIPVVMLWLSLAALTYFTFDLLNYPMEMLPTVAASEPQESVPWEYHEKVVRAALDESRRVSVGFLRVILFQFIFLIWLTITQRKSSAIAQA